MTNWMLKRFADPTDVEVRNEKNQAITIGDSICIVFCRVRGGWIGYGGRLIKDWAVANEYAERVLKILRNQKAVANKSKLYQVIK